MNLPYLTVIDGEKNQLYIITNTILLPNKYRTINSRSILSLCTILGIYTTKPKISQ